MRCLIFIVLNVFFIKKAFSLPTTNIDCNQNTEFDCKGGKLKCIPLEWQCDNVADCDNGLDELQCTYPIKCSPGYLMCKSGECVDKNFKCDKEDDCQDGTDEQHCGYIQHSIRNNIFSTISSSKINVAVPECYPPRMRCSSGQCIAADLICDGHPDCSNGDDETNCTKTHQNESINNLNLENSTKINDEYDVEKCRSGYVMCHSGDVCIPYQFICDGSMDCIDESDEADCDVDVLDETDFLTAHTSIISKCAADGKFHCRTENSEMPVCVQMNSTCNGIKDCPHGDDESMKCSECSRKQCDHTCMNTPTGAKCICQEGYKLANDGLTCEDENECLEHGHKCQHFCEDRIGSYICTCLNGYKLENDDHSCRLENDDSSGLLFVSLGSEVRHMPLAESEATYSRIQRIGGHGVSRAIDFVHSNNKLYLTVSHQQGDKIEGELMVSDNGLLRVLRENLPGIGNMAVDWMGGNIFFTQRSPAKHIGITACTTNGLFCRWIIKGQEKPKNRDMSMILQQQYRGLVVHPVRGLLIWIESYQGVHRIMISNLDGKNIQSLVDNKLGSPSGLAIDYVRDDIYFGDFEKKLIERININTKERRVVVSSGVYHPFDMVYFNGFLYWSDWGSENIKYQEMISHDQPSNPQTIHTFNRFPYGLAINHSMYQIIPSINPCAKFDCPWICVLVPKSDGISTAKCLCPDGYEQNEENNTCIPLKVDSDEEAEAKDLSFISSTLMEEYCDAGVGCSNGGTCKKLTNKYGRSHRIICECPMPFDGEYCERINPEMLKMMEEDSTMSAFSIVLILILVFAVFATFIYCWFEKRDFASDLVTNAKIRIDNMTRQAENATQPVFDKFRTIVGINGSSSSPREGIRSATNINFVAEEEEALNERRKQMLESPSSYRNPLYDEVPNTIHHSDQTFSVIGSSSPVAGVLRFNNDSIL